MAGTIFKNRIIGVTNNSRPVMIVGECPGKQRKKDQNFEVFHGNRTGDFVEKAIEGLSNIILTNAVNWQRGYGRCEIEFCKVELQKLICQYTPCKIICLGHVAKKTLDEINGAAHDLPYRLIKYPHPSFILRFNIEPNEYLKKLRSEIEKSLQHD